MKRGTLLDPVTGKPLVRADRILKAGYEDYHVVVPPSVQSELDKAEQGRGILGSNVGWRDILTPKRVLIADGAAVTNTTTETKMCPDYTFGQDVLEPGDVFKYTLFGDIDTVISAPGTITFRLRWGAAVSGVSLALSSAYAPDPTAAATAMSYEVVWTVVVRSTGAAGKMFAYGKIEWGDYDDASATTLKGNLDSKLAPAASPAEATVDTTAATALTPTVTFSVSTATTELVNHIAILESLN